MKNIGALLVYLLIGVGAQIASAQNEGLPPTDSLPGMEQLVPPGQEYIGSGTVDSGPTGVVGDGSFASDNVDAVFDPTCAPDHGYFGAYPALMESTGTWLRRGFWFAEVDALILNRRFDRAGTLLMYEGTNGIPGGVGAGGVFFNLHSNELIIYQGDPGAEALPRIKLGRFWFRDANNNDHTTELVWYGGGEWTQQSALTAVTATGLRVPAQIDRGSNTLGAQLVNPSFDGARAGEFRLNSYLDSIEFNYHVKQRMGRDRMELQPNGEWVRKASNSRTVSFLAGLRYINTRENLLWTASGIPDPNNGGANTLDGSYFVSTDNNLLGTQIGGTISFERDRWSVTGSAKAGGYYNNIDLNSDFFVGNISSGTSNFDTDNLSFVGEFQLLGKWHFRPNMSIRLSAEMLWIEALANSAHQLDFIPGNTTHISAAGDNVFVGTSIGFESYF